MASALPLLIALALGGAREDFGATWNDGRAELSGYRLTQPRYGQPRQGHAVMIWVTEPFSKSKHVKLDRPESAGADRLDVIKLNLVKRFRTGVYDYSLLTSVFSPLAFGKHVAPDKVSFTSQEWCGSVFAQLTREEGGLRSQWFSYFEAEGDGAAKLAAGDEVIFDDDLWWKLRELNAPFAPGKYAFAPALASVRLSHSPMALGTLEAKRSGPVELEVPAGKFATVRWDLAMAWGPQKQARTVWVEEKAPRRIIAWEGEAASFGGKSEPARERAELTGSFRDAYWQHNHLGDEALYDKLGLKREVE